MHFLKSLIYTIFSPSFYAKSVKKGAGKAWGVFFLFTILTTVLTTLFFAFDFGIDLARLPETMEDFPDARIENGELTVEGADMPIEYMEDGTCLIIDTTTHAEEVTIPRACDSGFLFTQYTMTVRTEERSEDISITYEELLADLDRESIVINEETVATFFQSFGLIIILLSPVFIFLGQIVGRLFMILLITILGLVVFSVMKESEAFKKSFIISMYAVIPVFYVNTVIKLVKRLASSAAGINLALGTMCCLIPLILAIIKWGIFWGIGAYGVRKMNTEAELTEK